MPIFLHICSYLLSYLLLLLLSSYTKAVHSIRLYEELELPTMVQAGDMVELYCNFQLDMEQSSLYSVKWYRDNVEFFRYIPSEDPHTTVFIIPGMELLETSSPTHIILGGVTTETGGEFKCEVSEGPPRFSTAARSTNLQVVDLPNTGPAIYGLRSLYKVGEFVNLTCESGPSSPPTQLSWILDGVRIQPESPLVSTMIPVYPLPDKRAISRSYLSLLLSQDSYMVPSLVECEASVGNIYHQTASVQVSIGHSFRSQHVSDLAQNKKTWKHWIQHFSGSAKSSVKYNQLLFIFLWIRLTSLFLKI